mmetsp:Transcript_10296/g.30975  ORF Transcript_10296/g.30975 Transcript_10296/m.30975 type:complete len:847 (-) Transcript_10296:187-2727(-)
MSRVVAKAAVATTVLAALTTAHLQELCMSAVHGDETQCDKVTLWLMTFNHGTAATATAALPGVAAVSVGMAPHPDSPLAFSSLCSGMAFNRSTVEALESAMPGWGAQCPAVVAGQLREGLRLTCFATVDPVTRVVTPRAPTDRSDCGADAMHLPIDEASFVVIPGVTGRQPLSIALSGVNHAFRGPWTHPAASGSAALSASGAADACSVATSESGFEVNKGAYGSTPDMTPIRFTIPAGAVAIPGCGVPCPPYTADSSLHVARHSCTADQVPPGTPCNVTCPAGYTQTGDEVSCVGGSGGSPGSYSGQISCVNAGVSLSSCADGHCPALTALLGAEVTQIFSAGCGAATAQGTECGFSCNAAAGYFSKGMIVASGGAWVKSADAECAVCEGGMCAACPDLDVPRASLLRPGALPGTYAVCLPGLNFDPVNDRVLIIDGLGVDCSSVVAGGGGAGGRGVATSASLVCNTAAAACGSEATQYLLACGGLADADVPAEGTVCLCDADAEGGCTAAGQRFRVQGPSFGPVTDAPTVSPTTSPTGGPTAPPTVAPTPGPTVSPTPSPTLSPTPSPTPSPTVSPTFSPTTPCSQFTQTFVIKERHVGCVKAATGDAKGGDAEATACYTAAAPRGSAAAADADTAGFEAAIVALWDEVGPFGPEAPLEQMLLTATTDGSWSGVGGTKRDHAMRLVYRAQSPLDHTELAAAARALEESTAAAVRVEYCGCTSEIRVVATTAAYNVLDKKKCKDAFKGGNAKENDKAAKMLGASATSAASTAETAVIVGMSAAVVVAIAVAGTVHRVRRRRGYQRRGDTDNLTALDSVAAIRGPGVDVNERSGLLGQPTRCGTAV